MLKLKKIFTCLVLSLLLLSSIVFATDSMPIGNEITIQEPSSTNNPYAAQTINDDLYIYNTDSYNLGDIIHGNVFVSTMDFSTNPRNNGGIISGNLFVISNEVTIGSDMTYSNEQDKNGNYMISSVSSHSVIDGNVYAFSDSFTLEAESEIKGDLYIASTNVDIQQNAVVHGNIFITATDVKLNGQVSGSAYILTDNFEMNDYAYISRDLYLNAETSTLSGDIYRNAFITSNNKLTTSSDFSVNQNIAVDYANKFTFSGEVKGNAIIHVKELAFSNSENEKCIINGNLKYATKNDMTVPDNIVAGEVTHFEFKEINKSEISIDSLTISFFSLLIYVFVIVYFSKRIASNAIEKLYKINIKNCIISFALGFASLVAAILSLLFLLLSGIGIYLALLLIVGYLFVLGLGLPLLLNDVQKLIKWKQNPYIKLLVITIAYYLISLIPIVGSPFVFVTLFIGTGRILLSMFTKKK